MRLSEIAKRQQVPESEQVVPRRRVVGWLVVAVMIAIGVYFFFRFGGALAPLLP